MINKNNLKELLEALLQKTTKGKIDWYIDRGSMFGVDVAECYETNLNSSPFKFSLTQGTDESIIVTIIGKYDDDKYEVIDNITYTAKDNEMELVENLYEAAKTHYAMYWNNVILEATKSLLR